MSPFVLLKPLFKQHSLRVTRQTPHIANHRREKRTCFINGHMKLLKQS